MSRFDGNTARVERRGRAGDLARRDDAAAGGRVSMNEVRVLRS
jgi:hypothetical protein